MGYSHKALKIWKLIINYSNVWVAVHVIGAIIYVYNIIYAYIVAIYAHIPKNSFKVLTLYINAYITTIYPYITTIYAYIATIYAYIIVPMTWTATHTNVLKSTCIWNKMYKYITTPRKNTSVFFFFFFFY